MGSEKMGPFDVLSMENISDFPLEPSNLHFLNLSKLIFALKPWVQAGRFEYHEPYNPKNFFFDL